jgi:hypothetical protein
MLVEDLEGAATLGQLEASRYFDPERGSWKALAHAAAVRAIRDELRLRYPVSAPRRTSVERLQAFFDTRGVVLAEDLRSSDAATQRTAKHVTFAKETLSREPGQERELWRKRVRTRVAQLLDEDSTLFALGVLSDELRPGEFATEIGAPASAVYAAAKRVVRRLSSDKELRQLWEEQP